mmetsp:Transcript_73447/g.215369  ORF Transcript_73447/g.215369 Transcript_73447/m.215369 type:complete len:444 (-) Transcript_73447:133-1464(-)
MKVVGDHHRASPPMLPEANHRVHAPVASIATIPVGVHEHDAASAARRPAVGLRLALLFHEDPPDRLEAVLDGDLELGRELRGEVAHKVEERRERDGIVLEDRDRVLLPEALQRHQERAGQPLHPFHLRVRLRAGACHVEASFALPVEEAHGLHPGLQFGRHVGHVLLLQDLVQALDARPLDLHVRLPVLDAVLALAAAGLHVPHGALRLLDPEVHDGVHQELLEDVLVAARDVCVAQQLLLLLRPAARLLVIGRDARVELLLLRDVLPILLVGLPDLPLLRRLVRPRPAQASLSVGALLLQADGRPAVVHLACPGGPVLALALVLALWPSLLPCAAGGASGGAGGRRPVGVDALLHLLSQLVLALLRPHQRARGSTWRCPLTGATAPLRATPASDSEGRKHRGRGTDPAWQPSGEARSALRVLGAPRRPMSPQNRRPGAARGR